MEQFLAAVLARAAHLLAGAPTLSFLAPPSAARPSGPRSILMAWRRCKHAAAMHQLAGKAGTGAYDDRG
jgi:hypothetical protein